MLFVKQPKWACAPSLTSNASGEAVQSMFACHVRTCTASAQKSCCQRRFPDSESSSHFWSNLLAGRNMCSQRRAQVAGRPLRHPRALWQAGRVQPLRRLVLLRARQAGPGQPRRAAAVSMQSEVMDPPRKANVLTPDRQCKALQAPPPAEADAVSMQYKERK